MKSTCVIRPAHWYCCHSHEKNMLGPASWPHAEGERHMEQSQINPVRPFRSADSQMSVKAQPRSAEPPAKLTTGQLNSPSPQPPPTMPSTYRYEEYFSQNLDVYN